MHQTRQHSRLEVAVDWFCMLTVNIGGQMLVYGALATGWRTGTFAAATIVLAVPRRYMTRRFFNALVTATRGQPRWQSWLEVGTDTLLAFAMSIVLQVLWYGPAATWAKAGGLTVGVYLLTLVRRYVLRRLFEWLARRQAARLSGRAAAGTTAVGQ